MNMGTKEAIQELDRYRVGDLICDDSALAVRKDAEAPFLSRRREERVNEQMVCAYGFCESLDEPASDH